MSKSFHTGFAVKVGFIGALLLSSALVAQADAATFRLGVASDALTVDPIASSDNPSIWTELLIYDQLVRPSKDGTKLEPGIAEILDRLAGWQGIPLQAARREILRRLARHGGRRRLLPEARGWRKIRMGPLLPADHQLRGGGRSDHRHEARQALHANAQQSRHVQCFDPAAEAVGSARVRPSSSIRSAPAHSS